MPTASRSLAEIAVQTAPDVWHRRARSSFVPRSVIEELKRLADSSDRKRCRLCLHVSPDDIDQQMLIVMHRDAQDRPHYHPSKIEVIQPIEGDADLIQLKADGERVRSISISARDVFCFVNEPFSVHFLEVTTDYFVFLEISRGPFTKESTVYLT
jgi:cupin fold WbuC family metalloprotein